MLRNCGPELWGLGAETPKSTSSPKPSSAGVLVEINLINNTQMRANEREIGNLQKAVRHLDEERIRGLMHLLPERRHLE